eukprot:PhM_4_TR12992/c0_g1_i1/m.67242
MSDPSIEDASYAQQQHQQQLQFSHPHLPFTEDLLRGRGLVGSASHRRQQQQQQHRVPSGIRRKQNEEYSSNRHPSTAPHYQQHENSSSQKLFPMKPPTANKKRQQQRTSSALVVAPSKPIMKTDTPQEDAVSNRPTIDTWPSLRPPDAALPARVDFGVATIYDSKPQLLMDLQNFLKKELSLLSEADRSNDLTRLRIYMEAMCAFSRQFKTYGCVLMEIMEEFEHAVRVREERSRHMEAWKRDAAVASQHTEEALQRQAGEHAIAVAELNNRLAHMSKRIHKLEHERDGLESELIRIRRSNETLKNEKKEDTEKILSLIQAVKESEERSTLMVERLARVQHDSERLKDTIECVRLAEQKYADLKERFRDNVTMSDYMRMKDGYERTITRMKSDETQLRRMYATRGSQIKTLKGLVDTMKKDSEQLKVRAATPRPQWRELVGCAGDGVGGEGEVAPLLMLDHDEDVDNAVAKSTVTLATEAVSKLREAMATRTSAVAEAAQLRQEVDTLQQLMAQKQDASTTVILCRGLGPSVPIYLQSYGVVARDAPGASLSHRAVIDIISNVMKERYVEVDRVEKITQHRRRATSLALEKSVSLAASRLDVSAVSGGSDPLERSGMELRPLSQFFWEYALEKHPTPEVAVQWSYTVWDACRRYGAVDFRCEAFLRMLDGELPESVVYFSNDVVTHVRKEFIAHASAGGVRRHKLKRKDFAELLQTVFPGKPVQSLDKLREAANAVKESMVSLDDILTDGSRFLDVIKQQAQLEYAELYMCVLNTVATTTCNDNREVEVHRLLPALQSVDPDYTEDYVAELVQRIFRSRSEVPATVPFDEFQVLLSTVYFTRKSNL